MSWSIGFDSSWNRDIGYGVKCYCDHPQCWAEIDRGLSYVCGSEPYGGEHGCGLYFCCHHLRHIRHGVSLCPRCARYKPPFKPKDDHRDWAWHKLRHDSWAQWRIENPDKAKALLALL
jgi:hypothetical protein